MAMYAMQRPAIRSRRVAAVLDAGAAIWRSIMWIVLATVVAVDIVLFGLSLDQDGHHFAALASVFGGVVVEAGVVAWRFGRLGNVQHTQKEGQK